LLSRLSSAQFAEWVAFLNIEPLEDHRNDSLLGQLLAMTGNVNRAADTEPFDPRDFMPWIDRPSSKAEEPEPIDHETQTTRLKALFKKEK
jgi:hypothetical protein